MKLQLALDDISLQEALDLVATLHEHVDIVEIGTPFIIEEGLAAVRRVRARFPHLEILADTKIMDAGDYEAASAFEAGADYVTVLGVSDLATIEACLRTADRYGKTVVVDMICVEDLPKRVAQLERLGVKAFAVHTGVDQQRNGRTPLDGLRLTKAHSRECTLFVAGGVTLSTLPSYITLGADVVIVGSGIRHAAEPAAEARAFQALLRQSSQGVGSAFVLPGVYARSGEDQTGNMAELARQVLQELDRTVLAISTPEADRLVEAIMGARRVFVAGAGRSGLAVKAFAMRLMHIGMQIFVAGEIVTPSISGHDLLFIGSGSGATPSLCVLAERARAAGAKVALATSFPESLLGAIADVIVKIPTPTPNSPIQEQAASVQPMGSLFEQSLLLFLDVIVLRLMQRTSTQVDAMFKRHANLE